MFCPTFVNRRGHSRRPHVSVRLAWEQQPPPKLSKALWLRRLRHQVRAGASVHRGSPTDKGRVRTVSAPGGTAHITHPMTLGTFLGKNS